MATARQKEAARQNIAKARQVQSARAHGVKIPRQSQGLSTAEKDKLPDKEFAFPKERKEPLTDARHVRNAIARFDQVEGITDAERDKAWKRIRTAAKRFNVDVSEKSWRELFKSSNKAAKSSGSTSKISKASTSKATNGKTSSSKAGASSSSSAKTSSAKTAKASSGQTSRSGSKSSKASKK